jgi:hypothetical protein
VSLSLELFVAGQATYSLINLAFGFVDDLKKMAASLDARYAVLTTAPKPS